MTTLASPPEFRKPRYKIMVHSTKFNRLTMASTYLDNQHDTSFVGWLEFPRGLIQKFSSDHIDKFSNNEKIDSTLMSFKLYEQDIDIMRYDAVLRTRDEFFVESGVSVDYAIDNDDGCYLLITIDDNGYTSPDTTGTVSFSGTDANDAAITDDVSISGAGTYMSSKKFKTISTSGISCAGLSDCAITVWGDTGLPFRRREMRVYVNTTNDDDNYGLVYAGFTTVSAKDVPYDDKVYTITGVGYDDFQKNNEYVAGFRSMSRCSNYVKTGQYGSCSASSPNWRVNGKCFVGDFNTYHPNGTVQCGTSYRCTDFVETSNYLPYDGYTYDEAYEDSEGTYYSPYPPDYFRFGLAIEKMCRSYEHDTKLSSKSTLFMMGRAELSSDLASDGSFVNVTNFEGLNTPLISTPLYIIIEDSDFNREIVYVAGGYGTSMGATTRGALKTEAQAFTTGDSVYFYEAGVVSKNMASENDMLIEGNISSTIWATMESVAETMTERIVNSSWVMWVDKYRQIHIDELYGDNPGYSDNFTLSLDDIADVISLNKSEVANSVSANVTTDDGTRYYPTLRVEETDIDPTGTSVIQYGRMWEEINNKQLNAIGATDLANGLIGFYTYAYNYLKVHAFPTHTQTIQINGTFIPDEHYWNKGLEPEFAYTDPVNQHIDLRTRRVNCPDFQLQGNEVKTFVIIGVKYVAEEYGDIVTYLTMSRIAND